MRLHNQHSIPLPTIRRLCKIYHLLEEVSQEGTAVLSSKEIGRIIGEGSHTVRKDISYLGEAGQGRAGYHISRLKELIATSFGFVHTRYACIIGIGALGARIMSYPDRTLHGFVISAAFDSNINRIETVNASIPCFPTYEIPEVVKRMNISLAVITEPDPNIHKITSRLLEGGIQAILNLTPMILKSDRDDVIIRNLDIISEFGVIAALLTLDSERQRSAIY